jgi:hypothetical protein
MAIPGHEFLTAHFSNNERTRVEYVEANPEDTAWKKLLTHIDIDSLHENTYQYIKQQNAAFEETVIKYGKERGLLYSGEVSMELYETLISLLFKPFDKKEDKEKLFMTKLKLFEVDQIKKSSNRALKAELRKAPTIAAAIKIGLQISEEIIKEAEEKPIEE